MMQSEALPPPSLFDSLPAARNTVPTLPFDLEEYARLSCLPDADDDLVFEAGPPLAAIKTRVLRVVHKAQIIEKLTHVEALLLSLVDGTSPVSSLILRVGTDPDEALVGVCDLYARGLVTID